MTDDVARCLPPSRTETLSILSREPGEVRFAKLPEPSCAATIKTATHIQDYIADYGTTLVDLPEDTWDTSVAQWYGDHWQVLVDLWTAEEGRSDLVLDCWVHETSDGYRIKVHLVYVP